MKCDPWSLQQQLGEEWSTHPPAYQDSWFRRDVFTAWDKQSKRMWEVLVKENKPIHFMFGNCICWNLSNLTKIVILQLFSLVSSQMCSLKTTCQNRFKFPYGHCFHICNLYLMETGTQCFKEETSNGERAVAKCLQKLSWHDGILLVLSSLGVVASWAVLFLPAERWTITGLSLHRLLFCFSGTLFHRPNCVLIIQSCDSSPVVLERLKKVLLANVRAMAISEF